MMELMERLHPLHRTLVSDGTDQAIEIIGQYLPEPARYRINRYPSGQKVWTWTVPPKFVVHEAYLEIVEGDRKKRLVDFQNNPLHLVSYAQPVDRMLTFGELEPHLHYNEQRPDAIPWVFKYYDKGWGFCLPYNTFRDLPRDARYHAVIRTEFIPDELKVGEYDILGTSDEYLLFIACVCHPCQVNDSISGLVVNVDLARRLAAAPPGHYNIKFLFLPETIGSIAYLANNEGLISRLKYGFFSEMIGHDNTLRLQRTRQDNTLLDRAAKYIINRRTGGDFVEGPYCHTIITNDEKVTNAPGVDIPTIAINRWPYDAYHTSDDRPSAMVPDKLAEVSIILQEIVEILQSNDYPRRKFRGPVFLSGLNLDLDWRADRELKRALQEMMFHLEGNETALDIALHLGINYHTVRTFLDELRANGLVESARRPWPPTV